MSDQHPHQSPHHSPAHSALAAPGPMASAGLGLQALDVETALHQNAAMQKAGAVLEQRVAALEAEKAALLRAAAARETSLALQSSQGHHSHSRLKGPTPPEFHGSKASGYEIDSWIRDMKVQFAFYGPREFPDDASKVRHAAMFLKGRAAEWWEATDKSEGVETHWDKFVERLHQRYRPMQAAAVARERLDRLRQKGSVSAYADVFQKELTPIKDMGAADQIFFFIKGLSSAAVANKVREKMPEKLHEAMDIAVRAEAFLGAGRAGQGAASYYPRHAAAGGAQGSSAMPMDVNAMEDAELSDADEAVPLASASFSSHMGDASATLLAKVEAMVEHRLAALLQNAQRGGSNAPGQRPADRVPGLKATDVEKLRSEGRCFRCKQKGHMKRECPKPSFH